MTFDLSSSAMVSFVSERGQKLLRSNFVALLLLVPHTSVNAEEPQACLFNSYGYVFSGASHSELFDVVLAALNSNPVDPYTYVFDENYGGGYHWGGGTEYSRWASLFIGTSGVLHRYTYSLVCCPSGSIPELPYSICRSYQWIAATSAKQSDRSCPSVRHPISLSSGNKFLRQQDIPGPSHSKVITV